MRALLPEPENPMIEINSFCSTSKFILLSMSTLESFHPNDTQTSDIFKNDIIILKLMMLTHQMILASEEQSLFYLT